jgi:hypothetical protein
MYLRLVSLLMSVRDPRRKLLALRKLAKERRITLELDTAEALARSGI